MALFRGINVGRAKRIAMADLRTLLEGLGFGEVRTLLNSGNAVFQAQAQDGAAMARTIRAAVAEQLGVDALVIVKSQAEIAAIRAGNRLAPAALAEPSRLLVLICQTQAQLAALPWPEASQWGADQLFCGREAAYLWCAGGVLESPLAASLLKPMEGCGTSRNWATLEKIAALLDVKD